MRGPVLVLFLDTAHFHHPLERKWENAAWSCCLSKGPGTQVTEEVRQFCHY